MFQLQAATVSVLLPCMKFRGLNAKFLKKKILNFKKMTAFTILLSFSPKQFQIFLFLSTQWKFSLSHSHIRTHTRQYMRQKIAPGFYGAHIAQMHSFYNVIIIGRFKIMGPLIQRRRTNGKHKSLQTFASDGVFNNPTGSPMPKSPPERS